MKAVNLVIAILVALGVAGIAYFMASAQTAELEKQVRLLEDNLDQTRVELERAKQALAKADTSKLQDEVNDLSEALWAKVGDLGNKDAELAAEIEKLASRPVPAGPRLAGNPGDPADPDSNRKEGGMQELVQGASRMFGGFRDRMIKRQMDTYTKELNLTESQSEDLKKALADQTSKMMEGFKKAFEGDADMDRRQLMEDFMKQRDEAIQAILTPEQFEKFKEIEKNQTGGMMRGFGGRGGNRRPRGGDQGQPGPGGNR